MHFFFYGTLMAGSDNPLARLVAAKLGEIGPATGRGQLYAIPTDRGWYPALVPTDGYGRVNGTLHAAQPGFAAADLAALDAYEAFDPRRPGESEYRRAEIRVTSAGGQMAAQAYLYHAALPAEAVPLPHGDFRVFLAGTGYSPYREIEEPKAG